VGFGGAPGTVDVDLHGDGEGVGCAVEGEDSGDLEGGVAGGGEGTGVGLGGEGDVGEFGGFEDLGGHLLIAGGVAGAAAAGGDIDEAGQGGGGGVEVDDALGDVEGSGGGVVSAEGEFDFAGVGVDVEGLVLGEREGDAEERKCCKERASDCLTSDCLHGCSPFGGGGVEVAIGWARVCCSQRLSEATSRSERYSWPGMSVPGMPNLTIWARRSLR
jgi:hypothetical protein